MARESVLVTGGNSGIGLHCARQLARDGRHVIIASRNQPSSEQAVREIERESGAGAAEALPLDLSSTESVRALAKEIQARDVPLRALVCNAGLQFTRGPQRNAAGQELTFAVNHLGHFLLVNLLLERLALHAPARIVVVSSGVHDPKLRTGMPKPEIGTLDALASTGCASEDSFDGRLAYVNSKLCNLWFAYELGRRIERSRLSSEAAPITVIAWEPGLVPGSGLARDYPAPLRFVWDRILPGVARLLAPLVPGLSTARRSGEALARTVTDPALGGASGRYYPSTARWAEAPSSSDSYDETRARELWQASARMVGLAPDESPLPS